MRARALPVALGGLFLALGVTATAGTYALYSDFETTTGNRVAAAAVFLGSGASDGLALTYPPLVEDVAARGELTVDYRGTVPADVTLSLDPGRATAFCERGPDGWHNAVGLALVVTIGERDPVSYCSLLDSGPVTLREAVPPGSTPFTTAVDLTLTENDLAGTEPVTAVDALVVEASGGFTDRAEGTLTAPVEPAPLPSPEEEQRAAETSAAPPALATALAAAASDPGAPLDPALIPRRCRDAGMVFRPDQVVQLTGDDVPWSADRARGTDTDPLLVFGTDGDDDITGSPGGDCIVGGEGADRVLGAGGGDVLLGGGAADVLDGGDGADTLSGGTGPDTLVGGPGVDTFDGGPDGATCDGGPDGRATGPGCEAPPPVAPGPVTTVPPPGGSEPPLTPTSPAGPAPPADPVPSGEPEPSPGDPDAEPEPGPGAEPNSGGGSAPSEPEAAAVPRGSEPTPTPAAEDV